jgi:hypothetical protein
MASSVVMTHLHSLASYLKGLFQSEAEAWGESNRKWRACMQDRLKENKGQPIPEYQAAILSCSVTLQQIVEARHHLQTGWYSSEENPLILYEELLWLAYQRAHGRIEEYYFGMGGRAAVVLTSPHRRSKAMDLDLFYPLDDLSHLTPDFESTLWTCISQFQSIAELDLKFKGQDAVFLELYLIVIYIFVVVEAQQANRQDPESLDAPSAHEQDLTAAPGPVTAKATEDIPGKAIKKALNHANDHLKKLTRTIDQFSRREAQVIYIRGMFLGILSVLALVAVYVYVIFHVSAARHWTSGTQLLWHLIAIAVTSGGLGAVVSVMLRVSNRPLSISYNAGRSLIWFAGYFRSIVGAIFGLAFYVLINAGLLQVLAAPRNIGSRAFFIAAICFAAGFSERRAQDFIVRALPTEKKTESDADESPARRPEEGRII